ncbi:hypothetical protein AAVH_30687, partial [Aphelenchoides avenae]
VFVGKSRPQSDHDFLRRRTSVKLLQFYLNELGGNETMKRAVLKTMSLYAAMAPPSPLASFAEDAARRISGMNNSGQSHIGDLLIP